MPAIQFMPWCPIDKEYKTDKITVIPFEREGKLEGVDDLAMCHIRTVLASYKDRDGKPIQKAALIQYEDKSLLSDLSEEEIDITREIVKLVRFAGLANRAYVASMGLYCNADCFIQYAFRFPDEPTYVTLVYCQRGVRIKSGGWAVNEITFSIPVHVDSISKVRLDENLLQALLYYRNKNKDNGWPRWQNAISCYNQANTDNPTTGYHVEWVLHASAFERLLDATSYPLYEDVAGKFYEAFVPNDPIKAKDAKQKSTGWDDLDTDLRFEWMKEFYRVRGDFAHGRLQSQQPMVWKPAEHIVLASIAFPFLVKSLLAQKGLYTLTDDDQDKIDAFESLASEDFLNYPPNQKGSGDSWWGRCINAARSARDGREISKIVDDLDKKYKINKDATKS